MNSSRITEIVRLLRSDTDDCPQCYREYPKHESTCAFVDFQVVEILASVSVLPGALPSNFKTQLYDFIRERSSKTDFLEAVVYVFTTDALYPTLSVTESNMEVIVEGRSIWRVISSVFDLFNGIEFFKDTGSVNVSTAPLVSDVIQLVYDIKGTRLGRNYSYSSTAQKQRIGLWYMMYYIRLWLNRHG